jgi:hypothetical protein
VVKRYRAEMDASRRIQTFYRGMRGCPAFTWLMVQAWCLYACALSDAMRAAMSPPCNSLGRTIHLVVIVVVVVVVVVAVVVLHTPNADRRAIHLERLKRRRVVPTPLMRDLLLAKSQLRKAVGDWQLWCDKDTGAVFYVHVPSGETQWLPPEVFKVRRHRALYAYSSWLVSQLCRCRGEKHVSYDSVAALVASA